MCYSHSKDIDRKASKRQNKLGLCAFCDKEVNIWNQNPEWDIFWFEVKDQMYLLMMKLIRLAVETFNDTEWENFLSGTNV